MRCAARRLLILMLFAALAHCAKSEVVTASYASRAEARSSGAIDRGWVPTWVPESAEDIREAHGTDSRRRWGLFNFAPVDGDAIRAALDPAPVSLAGLDSGMPSRVEWWPVILRGTLDAEKIKSAALEAYRTKTGNLVVVVNWKQGRAYYWGE
jgi:hypothetical protein